MDEAAAALGQGDTQRVGALIQEYRRTYQEHRKLLV
jgi:hypothetical protein